MTRRQSFQPWLQAGAFVARENGVRFIPHGWNTAVGLASDLQIASAMPETDLVEYLTGSPFIDEIAKGGWRLDADGMLPIPDKPGLGLTVDAAALAEHARVKFEDVKDLCG